MPVIVITRLRLKDPALFDEFFASAVAVVEQARSAAGNLGADVLAEANSTYWTRTAWQKRDLMDAFVGSEPHLHTMSRIDGRGADIVADRPRRLPDRTGPVACGTRGRPQRRRLHLIPHPSGGSAPSAGRRIQQNQTAGRCPRELCAALSSRSHPLVTI
jgi:hypothetical protein